MIPRGEVGLIVASVIGALVLGTYSLRGEMQTIIEQLPEAAAKVTPPADVKLKAAK